jgi:hypothetical protein
VICEVLLKFVPLTVIGIAGDPATALFGVNPETVGAALRMFTLKLADPPVFEIRPFRIPGFCVSLAVRLNVAVLPVTEPLIEPRIAVVGAVNPVP